MKKIVLTGGGTAGHVMPNMALLPLLKKEFSEIHYIGSDSGLEKEIVARHEGVIFHEVPCAKLKRSFSPSNIAMPFKVMSGITRAKKLLKEIKPDVIFSKGGYVAAPVVLAHGKIPVVCHESDLTMGLSNKISSGCADIVCTSFERTAAGKKNFVYTGTPIRAELSKGDAQKAVRLYGVGAVKPVILVTGGSLGSKALNECVRACLPKLLAKFDIIHITGKGNVDYGITETGYNQIAFTYEIQDLFALAEVVITRGGSNAINELLYLAKPMLIVPLPKNASRGDQIDNAKYFESQGYARALMQENMTPDSLYQNITELFKDKKHFTEKMLSQKSLCGNEAIIEQIKKVIQNNEGVNFSYDKKEKSKI